MKVIPDAFRQIDHAACLVRLQDGRDQKIIRTPAGHQILFDDQAKEITISTATGAKVVLKDSGEITLEAQI